MRISDWSSDVCSSDLGPGRTGCLYRSSPSDDLLRDGLFRAGLRAAGTAHLSGSACSRSDICGPRRLRSGLRSHNGFRRQASLQHGGPARCFGSWKVARRSEEHTSELQSLMRLSYAVLWLTKTKHDKNK